MHRLISYFLSNISAKNYRNLIEYVKIIASQRWDVFETQCSIVQQKFIPPNKFLAKHLVTQE